MGMILRSATGRLAALSAAALLVGAAPPAAISSGELRPGGEPAPSYGADPGRKCPATTVSRLVMEELTGAAQRAGRPAPQLDGRLCDLASSFLFWDQSTHGTPRGAVLAFASHWFGLPGSAMPPVVGKFDVDDNVPAQARQIADRVVESVGTTVINGVHPRLGIAVQRSRRGRDISNKVSVVVFDVPLELEPLPRRLELGKQAVLAGKLLGGVRNARVLVSDALGRLTDSQQQGDTFTAEVKCGDRPGRIQVEIRGEYGGGTPILASFPVACGTALPTSVALAGEQWPADPAAAERKILDLVNRERTQAGLAALAWDAGVAGVARTISEDLAARGGAAGGADVGAELKKAGIGSPLVLQSAVSERTFERAHERLLASPTNRVNLMNPEVTNAGIGGVSKMDVEGRTLVYVTEVFIKELPPLDVAKVRQQLRDAVAQKRRDARTNAIVQDAALDEAAQRYAEALAAAGGTLAKERQTELTAPLNKGFKTVTMVSGAKQEPLDFAEEPQTTAPAKALGVGVALGKHPVLGRNAAFVVLMVGTPRGAAAEEAAAPPAKRKAPAPKARK